MGSLGNLAHLLFYLFFTGPMDGPALVILLFHSGIDCFGRVEAAPKPPGKPTSFRIGSIKEFCFIGFIHKNFLLSAGFKLHIARAVSGCVFLFSKIAILRYQIRAMPHKQVLYALFSCALKIRNAFAAKGTLHWRLLAQSTARIFHEA